MNRVIDTIKTRRSVRGFKQQQISDKDLQAILECAINAPSACNMQSWHFTVIQNQEVIKYINDTAKNQLKKSPIESFRKYGEDNNMDLLYGAPTLIIVSGNKAGVNPLIDCAAATQNMLLCAKSLGLGTLWNGLVKHAFDIDAVKIKIDIKSGYDVYFGIAVGYESDDFTPADKVIIRDGVVDYIR